MREFKKNLKFVWKYSNSERKRIVIYCILSLFDIVVSIIYPIVSAKIIVNLTDSNIKQFIYTGAVLVSVYLIGDITTYFKSKLYEKIFRQIYINIQSCYYLKVKYV